MPRYAYYISPWVTPLSPANAVWQESLPLARPTSGKSAEIAVSHGEYFNAVRSFCEQDGCEMFCGVVAQRLQQTVSPGDIQEIRVHLEKHGEFYHPARIVTDLPGYKISFVLNVALSEPGKKHINGEFHHIKRLNTEFAESFLPEVYCMGEVTTGGGIKFYMFLGEWFQDYHEFHISRQTSGNQDQVCVWDDRKGRYYLSREQQSRLYRQAARIMTGYYNVTTFEHISPWHHAAGDFIIRLNQNIIDLKLITVRGYAPLLQDIDDQTPGARNAEQILQALLIFFLKLSIWMRLDRVDGVGELTWSDPGVVQSTVEGIFEGLAQKPANPILPDAVDRCFQYYLSICTPGDLFDLSESILQTIHPAAPEIPLIKQNLADHVLMLIQSIKKI
ncbi:hypothetical protein D1BOALGB6SA_1320 [Olavius sp. associated proteobacterium Delta 1]|nr:hypothetical protein D1BOALGB6SA_1320 [Olavius sp. associated proteobacterium Delta 1]